MAAVFTFENGKQICFGRTIYANGKYVFLKDYQLSDEERRAVRDQLTRANNQIDDLKEQIAKIEKTRSSWSDNAVEWREKCEKDEKKIKELEHELRKKADSETDGLDFTEHDKVFEDKIVELENIINHKLGDWDEHGIPYKEILDMKAENQELKQRIYELENKETVELPFDALETANMLINAEYSRQTSSVEKAFTGCNVAKGHIYSVDDLEQIAEHLLVYCKHNREEVK